MKICLSCASRFEQATWECPNCSFRPEKRDGFIALSTASSVENEIFDEKAFQQLFEMEAGSFWFRSRNKLVFWALRHFFPDAGNLLEVGCGTAFVLSGLEREFPALRVSGSEFNSKGLIYAGKRTRSANLWQMDARSIPFSEEFDVIGAFDVLEHIREDEQVIGQMHQALKVDGGLLITVPQHAFLWSEIDKESGHVRRYAAADLKGKLERAGFSVVYMTSFVSLLIPLMLLSRTRPKKAKEEFHMNPVLDSILEAVMNVERWLISMGLSFPLGGSLLLVAKKKSS